MTGVVVGEVMLRNPSLLLTLVTVPLLPDGEAGDQLEPLNVSTCPANGAVLDTGWFCSLITVKFVSGPLASPPAGGSPELGKFCPGANVMTPLPLIDKLPMATILPLTVIGEFVRWRGLVSNIATVLGVPLAFSSSW